MNTFLLLLLALASAFAWGSIQTYRLRVSVDYMKRLLDEEAAHTECQRSQVSWWREKANWLNELNHGYRSYHACNNVLDEHPRLHAKQLRRILNAHLKKQYRAITCHNNGVYRQRVSALFNNCMDVTGAGFVLAQHAFAAKSRLRGDIAEIKRIRQLRESIVRAMPFNSCAP